MHKDFRGRIYAFYTLNVFCLHCYIPQNQNECIKSHMNYEVEQYVFVSSSWMDNLLELQQDLQS
jgi:hypothetical protein